MTRRACLQLAAAASGQERGGLIESVELVEMWSNLD
jgi:hypothetical protein